MVAVLVYSSMTMLVRMSQCAATSPEASEEHDRVAPRVLAPDAELTRRAIAYGAKAATISSGGCRGAKATAPIINPGTA